MPRFRETHRVVQSSAIVLQTAKVEKIRRRRRSRRNGVSELTAGVLMADVKPDPKDVLKQMQHESEFAKRINLAGDLLRKAMPWIEENNWEKYTICLWEAGHWKRIFVESKGDLLIVRGLDID